MVAITNLLLLAVAATASVLPRDAATIEADFRTINNDTVTLTQKVNAWSGGLFAAQPIQNAYQQLDNDVKSANTDAQNSAPVSDSDAQTVIDYINNTLEPNIKTSIQAFENKKPQFDQAGLSKTVLSNLKTLKNDTDTLGSSLIAKTPSDKQSAAQSALSNIDSDLQGGINYFS